MTHRLIGRAAAKRERRAMCASIALLMVALAPVFAVACAATVTPSWAPFVIALFKLSPFNI